MTRRRSEHGAAAVEFALVVPLLLLVMLAIIDFGWIFNQQLRLTAAAREGARHYAIHSAESGAQADAEALATNVAGVSVTIAYDSTCSDQVADDVLTMRVTAPMDDLTGWLDAMNPGATLSGVGSMRCGG